MAIAVAAELVLMVVSLLRGDRGARSGEASAHRYGLPEAWGRPLVCNVALFAAGIGIFLTPFSNDAASYIFADECWFTATEKTRLVLCLLAMGMCVLSTVILGMTPPLDDTI